jgi:hypothetical protein
MYSMWSLQQLRYIEGSRPDEPEWLAKDTEDYKEDLQH